MSWLKDVENRIGFPNAVETQPRFIEDGTAIDFTSLPSPHLVLKIRYLERSRSGVNHFFRGRQRCDLIALVDNPPKITVVLVEAKSGNDSNNEASKSAVAQLGSSLEIMRDSIAECELDLPFDSLASCDAHAVCVMESMRGSRPANATQRGFATQFYRQNRVPLRYLPADQDIWQTIQGQ